MARLSKHDLLLEAERGFEEGGWDILFLSRTREHPARYRITRGARSFTVRIYVWNITHGGGHRNAAEYRIQITGLNPNQFVSEVGGKTLILGYWANESVFAGWDYNFHTSALGGSPSMQIGEVALLAANQHRFAPHQKENGELAIAFRPDFIGDYVENLDELHASGHVPREVALLTLMAQDPDQVPEQEIARTVAGPRQYAVTQARRALRALDFKDRVLTAYGHQCAACGVQLRLLDGAHILPVSEVESTDETSNGVALCALHHRAYDRALLTFDEQYRVHLNDRRIRELQTDGHDGKLPEFRGALRRAIHLPPARADRPDPRYIAAANTLRGWAV